MIRLCIAFCGLLALLESCQQPPLTREDVIGSWVLSDESRMYFRTDELNFTSIIQLRANGTAEIRGAPYLSDKRRDEVLPKLALMTCTGSWQLADWTSATTVMLECDTVLERGIGELPYIQHLSYDYVSGAPSLYYYPGDPDGSKKIRFFKVQNASNK